MLDRFNSGMKCVGERCGMKCVGKRCGRKCVGENCGTESSRERCGKRCGGGGFINRFTSMVFAFASLSVLVTGSPSSAPSSSSSSSATPRPHHYYRRSYAVSPPPPSPSPPIYLAEIRESEIRYRVLERTRPERNGWAFIEGDSPSQRPRPDITLLPSQSQTQQQRQRQQEQQRHRRRRQRQQQRRRQRQRQQLQRRGVLPVGVGFIPHSEAERPRVTTSPPGSGDAPRPGAPRLRWRGGASRSPASHGGGRTSVEPSRARVGGARPETGELEASEPPSEASEELEASEQPSEASEELEASELPSEASELPSEASEEELEASEPPSEALGAKREEKEGVEEAEGVEEGTFRLAPHWEARERRRRLPDEAGERPATYGPPPVPPVMSRDSGGHASYLIIDGGRRRYPLAYHRQYHASTTKEPWANSGCPWPDSADPCIECRCDPIRGCTRRFKWITCNIPPCVNPVVLEGTCCPTCLEGRNCFTPWPDMPVMMVTAAGVRRGDVTCVCPEIEGQVYFQRDGYDRSKHEAKCTHDSDVVRVEVPVHSNGSEHQGWTQEELLKLLQPVQTGE